MTGVPNFGGNQGGTPFNQSPDPTQAFGGSFWGNTGDPSNPAVTAAAPAVSAQTQAAAAPPPPPPTTPTPTASSLQDMISNVLFGGGSGQTKTQQQGAFDAFRGGVPAPPLTAPGTTAAALPPTSAPGSAGGYSGGQTASAGSAPYNISPSDATISPQSAPVSGNTGDVSAPDTSTSAGETPAAGASPAQKFSKAATAFSQGLRPGSMETAPGAPDIAGSAREAGAGPGAAGVGSTGSPFQAPGNETPQVLQDLFSGNFGRFMADLLGQQGLPQGQNYAGTPRPGGGMAAVPPETAGTAPRPVASAAPLPATMPGPGGGFGGGQTAPSPTPTASAATPAAVPSGAIGDPMGYQGGTGGQPTQMAARPTGIAAPAAAIPAEGRKIAALEQPPGGQSMPDGSRVPTNGMPGGLTPSAPPPLPGLGAIPNQANRPRHYEGTLTMPDGTKYRYGTGGAQFASAPYGTYQIHPGAVGSIGRSIGAWAGYSDSNNPGNNTVHDPLYKGAGGTSARSGVEIHPDVSGRRLRTNGCIGIDRGQSAAFGQSFKAAAARGPLMMTIKPDGSARIFYANAPPPEVAGSSIRTSPNTAIGTAPPGTPFAALNTNPPPPGTRTGRPGMIGGGARF